MYLKLDFWNRYVSAGSQAGRSYSGLTAKGLALMNQPPDYFPWTQQNAPG